MFWFLSYPMPTLNGLQLTAVTTVHDDQHDNVNFWVPNTYAGLVGGADEANLVTRACWNWALTAGTQANDQHASSPLKLYENTSPIDPFTDLARHALNPGDFAGQYGTEPNLTALWNTAKGAGATDADRIAFMEAMARIAARANGLVPSNAPTPYLLAVTAPAQDWYHWQHWALGITSGGQTRYIQTEPNIPINWGFSRVWEANRAGHLTAEIYLTGILQRHKDVIEIFLSLPRCRNCNRVKPRQTTWQTRWHRCTSPARHVYCGPCGARLSYPGYVQLGRARRCSSAFCQGASTELMDDNAR